MNLTTRGNRGPRSPIAEAEERELLPLIPARTLRALSRVKFVSASLMISDRSDSKLLDLRNDYKTIKVL